MALVGFKAKNHPQQKVNPLVDDRALPHSEFLKLHEEFKFTIDVAASRDNTKMTRFYSIEDCGLKASWAGERVYCNPPYSNIGPWVEKAHKEVDAEIIVMVLPANRTEQKWWQEYIEPCRDLPWVTHAPYVWRHVRTRFLPGRMRFLKPGQTEVGPNERPPFGIVLCIW